MNPDTGLGFETEVTFKVISSGLEGQPDSQVVPILHITQVPGNNQAISFTEDGTETHQVTGPFSASHQQQQHQHHRYSTTDSAVPVQVQIRQSKSSESAFHNIQHLTTVDASALVQEVSLPTHGASELLKAVANQVMVSTDETPSDCPQQPNLALVSGNQKAPPTYTIPTDRGHTDAHVQLSVQPTAEKPRFSDRLIWCDDCKRGYFSKCSKHGSLIHIRDRQIPSRAKLTTPHHLTVRVIELRPAGNNVYGVFAKKVIQKRTQFGPYEGDLTPNPPSDHRDDRITLKLFKSNGSSVYLDNTNEDTCNWMMFVRPAKTDGEQNAVIYQYRGSIYFTTIKHLPPNAELRAWYSRDYGEHMESAQSCTAEPVTILSGGDLHAEDEDVKEALSEDESPSPLSPLDDVDGPEISDAEDAKSLETPAKLEVTATSPEKVSEVETTSTTTTEPAQSQTSVTDTAVDTQAAEEGTPVQGGRRTKSKRKGQPVRVRQTRRGRVVQLPSRLAEQSVTRKSRRKVKRAASPRVPETEQVIEKEQEPENKQPDGTTVDDDETPPVTKPIKRKRGRPAVTHKKKLARIPNQPKLVPKKRRQPGIKTLYTCEICEKVFAKESMLKQHSYTHTGEKPFQCEAEGCDKAFTSKFKLIRHELIHGGSKKHQCSFCEKSFSRKDHLKNHLKVHDPNKPVNHCDQCGKEYSSNYAFRTHLSYHHLDRGELICLVCHKEFEKPLEMTWHLKAHSGARAALSQDKNQTCPVCHKNFYTKKDVKRHLVVHTKNRDFLCQYCPQRFGRRDHLVRHVKKAHSGINGIEDPMDPKKESMIDRSMDSQDINSVFTEIWQGLNQSQVIQESSAGDPIIISRIAPGNDATQCRIQVQDADNLKMQNVVSINTVNGQNQEHRISDVPVMSGFIPPLYIASPGAVSDAATAGCFVQPLIQTNLTTVDNTSASQSAQSQAPVAQYASFVQSQPSTVDTRLLGLLRVQSSSQSGDSVTINKLPGASNTNVPIFASYAETMKLLGQFPDAGSQPNDSSTQ